MECIYIRTVNTYMEGELLWKPVSFNQIVKQKVLTAELFRNLIPCVFQFFFPSRQSDSIAACTAQPRALLLHPSATAERESKSPAGSTAVLPQCKSWALQGYCSTHLEQLCRHSTGALASWIRTPFIHTWRLKKIPFVVGLLLLPTCLHVATPGGWAGVWWILALNLKHNSCAYPPVPAGRQMFQCQEQWCYTLPCSTSLCSSV